MTSGGSFRSFWGSPYVVELNGTGCRVFSPRRKIKYGIRIKILKILVEVQDLGGYSLQKQIDLQLFFRHKTLFTGANELTN